ncbi:MAG TPA: hypothetical protein VFB95_07005 [Candidatus Cryosericum sp.]|nr:hypothetical protein [Candidatus Cryosericum sp.]
MQDAAVVIGLVLLAVLVGALLPVFYHAVQTLKSVKQFADTTAPRLEHALRELSETAARMNRIGVTLEGEGERLKPLFDSAASLGQTLQNLRRSLQIAGTVLGAVGPALLAGLGAFTARRGRSGDGDAGQESEGDAADEEADAGGGAPVPSMRASEESLDGH